MLHIWPTLNTISLDRFLKSVRHEIIKKWLIRSSTNTSRDELWHKKKNWLFLCSLNLLSRITCILNEKRFLMVKLRSFLECFNLWRTKNSLRLNKLESAITKHALWQVLAKLVLQKKFSKCRQFFYVISQYPIVNERRRYMAEILPIRR